MGERKRRFVTLSIDKQIPKLPYITSSLYKIMSNDCIIYIYPLDIIRKSLSPK